MCGLTLRYLDVEGIHPARRDPHEHLAGGWDRAVDFGEAQLLAGSLEKGGTHYVRGLFARHRATPKGVANIGAADLY